MEKNNRYKNKTIKAFDEIKEFLEPIVTFEKGKNPENIFKELEKKDLKDKRVWALFGSNKEHEEKDWECLQVAQTKKQIKKEIKMDIEFMIENTYENLLKRINQENKISKSTTFYNNAYEMERNKDRRIYSYSKMYSEYKYFMVCTVKVDEYLGIESNDMSEDISNIINISKYLYAEGKLAYETLAKYWNMYNSAVDGQAIMLFLERDK